MVKVSIIVPVYNVEKYLKKCLDSIINQTLKEIEIICINDGSTDNSLKILEEYREKDSRIIVIDKSNEGRLLLGIWVLMQLQVNISVLLILMII